MKRHNFNIDHLKSRHTLIGDNPKRNAGFGATHNEIIGNIKIRSDDIQNGDRHNGCVLAGVVKNPDINSISSVTGINIVSGKKIK